ncbi:MAG: pseudouridine synthase [Verrucomicrobiales bacterium]|nr:pseudouridine synthase [Verrucomicrobiales bacterium]
MRLDRFIAKQRTVSERSAREWIIAKRVAINGTPTRQHGEEVSRFDRITFDGRVLQPGTERLYFMLNKPKGILSATKDNQHTTVIDLLDHPDKTSLHLAGRLDRSSTGLMILTNDGSWSDRLTQPDSKVAKSYLVETDRPIPEEAVALFESGFEFPTEGITTRPAQLSLLGPCLARVVIHEGRYHQIKRMFHRINEIRLVSLHRESIGEIRLPDELAAGAYRALTSAERESIL